MSAKHRATAQLLASPRRASDPHAFHESIATLVPALGGNVPSAPTPVAHPALAAAPATPFGAYLRMLRTMEAPLPCVHTEPQTTVLFDPWTGQIHGKSMLSVRRPFEELRRIADPQHWDDMVPQYFAKACVVDCSGPGGCVVDPQTHEPTCDPNPPAPGTDWEGTLFENYRLNIAKIVKLVEFKNLLHVKSETTPNGHRFTYALSEVLYGQIALATKVGAGLDLDDGYIQLTARPDGWVDVEATKDFHLKDWGPAPGDYLLNWWTSITIRTTLDAAYEAICKDI